MMTQVHNTAREEEALRDASEGNRTAKTVFADAVLDAMGDDRRLLDTIMRACGDEYDAVVRAERAHRDATEAFLSAVERKGRRTFIGTATVPAHEGDA